MNRHQFLNAPEVISFVRWIAPHLKTIPVSLSIPQHNRFVPGGVNIRVVGADAVTSAYMWRAAGMTKGDWVSTRTHCSTLAVAMRKSVNAGNHADSLEAAWRIIQWGGGNQTNGAYPFLLQLGANLVPYLRRAEQAFRLKQADTNAIVPPVTAMNSMLTKVHAFLATDGLPIYDSRVAVATATLVETWRRATLSPNMLAVTPIPDALHFPTLNGRDTSRVTVWRRFPNAIKPKHLYLYNPATALAWSGAKIRLAWLMEELLNNQPDLFATEGTLADRMRALEAALFMIGYDVMCLK
jgi:hypothetical protein